MTVSPDFLVGFLVDYIYNINVELYKKKKKQNLAEGVSTGYWLHLNRHLDWPIVDQLLFGRRGKYSLVYSNHIYSFI